MGEAVHTQGDTAVFLFDVSGVMAQPWLDAGYECWTVDIQHKPDFSRPWPHEGVRSDGRLHRVHYDLTRPWLPPFPRERVAFGFAFSPCDHLAVSGARWFRGKGLRRLAWSLELFASAVETLEWIGAPYGLENPKSNIASHWRPADYSFSPHEYTQFAPEDCYTKETHVWAGEGFRMPPKAPLPEVAEAIAAVQERIQRRNKSQLPPKRDALAAFAGDQLLPLIERWYPDNRIHDAPPSDDRADIRSQTPLGFARAVFAANAPHVRRAPFFDQLDGLQEAA